VRQFRRIHVTGISGSGKTTVAGRIAGRLGIPHIELDALHWQPRWQEPELEAFRQQVAAALAPEAWVLEGNYRKVHDLVWSRAQQVIFLDLPLALTLWRLMRRTVGRSLRNEVLWAGNRENLWTTFFTRESLIYYALRVRKRLKQRFEQDRQDPNLRHIEFLRLSSDREISAYIQSL